MMKEIYIGTSGWYYDHWRGNFYPEDLASKALLPFYAERFSTVEVNNTFYHLPGVKTVRQWYETTPATFTFSVKASRYITHLKKLRDPEDPVTNFISCMENLEDKLGPILFQIPPHWNIDTDRLGSFLQQLPGSNQYAFEFRDPSWLDKQVYDLLRAKGAAFCIHDMNGKPSPKLITADFIYIRFHGPGKAYQGTYSTQVLAGWAGAISSWRQEGRDVYCYFNNDQAGYATQDALELQAMLNT